MSCHVIDDDLMHRCAAAMMMLAPPIDPDAFNPTDVDFSRLANTPQSWGNRLYDMNKRAFLACYQGRHAEDAEPGEYTFQPWPLRPPLDYPVTLERMQPGCKFPIAEMYRAVEYLRYHCSQKPVDDTPLFKALDSVSNRLAHFVASKAPAVLAIPYGTVPAMPGGASLLPFAKPRA